MSFLKGRNRLWKIGWRNTVLYVKEPRGARLLKIRQELFLRQRIKNKWQIWQINKFIDRGHCKRLRRKILIASYSLSHFTLTTTQLNLSFQKTLNYFKTIQTGFIFSQPPLNLFKPDKHVGSFLVRTSFQTNDQPGPKRSIKITDHFTCTCANVIYCITCTFCRKL